MSVINKAQRDDLSNNQGFARAAVLKRSSSQLQFLKRSNSNLNNEKKGLRPVSDNDPRLVVATSIMRARCSSMPHPMPTFALFNTSTPLSAEAQRD
eukprot:7273406-Pyramimonas_sp.AAC.1